MKTWKPLLFATLFMTAIACNRQRAPRTQITTNQSVAATSSQASGIQATPPSTGDASFQPKRGFVPDEQTAIAIAVAVWNPIYGKEHIEGEKPFHATLKDGVWTVTGSLPEGYNGGTALAVIAQDDGRILRVIHYQ
jgi:hypothetical protein